MLFYISQGLVVFAIIFDVMSFQFRERKKIIFCLFCGAILIAVHFVLLGQWTAALLMTISPIRYAASYYSPSRKIKYSLFAASIVMTAFTFSGLASLISCCGSLLQTIAAFSKEDKPLRIFMAVGICFWIIHNVLVGSPMAVVVEIIFLFSTLLGLYRFHYRNFSSQKADY